MNSILEIYAYLHEREDYRQIFDSHEEIVELHRNQLEHLLVHSLYDNIIKIYRFATGEERRFLDIIITRFEIDAIKKCIANIGKDESVKRVVTYANFFKEHSSIDVTEISKAKDIRQFTRCLKGTKYFKLFEELLTREYVKLSDYETALDIAYYTGIWNAKNTFNSDTEEIITHFLGTEIDLYNIKNIFRCKKFYNMSPDIIRSYVVSEGYRIKKQELEAMINAIDINGFIKEFKMTFYAKSEISYEIKNLEASFERTRNDIHFNFIKKNPNSLARVYAYFDKKSYEVNYLTRIIENIRYKNKQMNI
jgi:V/A-type H+-transporting ATPase subunit C